MMNNTIEPQIKNIENHFNNVIGWTPKEFSKLKNQLSCQDYGMAEKKMDQIEFELFFHSAYGDEIKNLLNHLKDKIIELKLEKEQSKLNNY